jgi:hypothetical protein
MRFFKSDSNISYLTDYIIKILILKIKENLEF